MKKRKLQRLVKQKMNDIERHTMQLFSSNDAEVIHRLRVGFKKLRALIRLAASAHGADKKLQVPEGLKNIYHAAGEVRNLQLYRQAILPFFKDTDSYPTIVTGEIDHASAQLTRAIKDFKFHKARREILHRLPSKLPGKVLDRFIKDKTEVINELLKKDMPDEDMHSIRKALKDISYNIKALKADEEKYLPIANRKSLAALTALMDTFNEYQDHVVHLSLLDSVAPEHNSAIVAHIRGQWEEKKILVKERI